MFLIMGKHPKSLLGDSGLHHHKNEGFLTGRFDEKFLEFLLQILSLQ